MNRDDAPVSFGVLVSTTLRALNLAPLGVFLLFVANLVLRIPDLIMGRVSARYMELSAWHWIALPAMIFYCLAQAVLTSEMVARLEGRESNPRAALRAAWSRAGVYLLLSLAVSLAAGLGLFLFIVPGIFFYLCLSLAGTASVAEGLGFSASLKRSVELTRGRRLLLFATYFLFVFLGFTANDLLANIMGGFGSGFFFVGGTLSGTLLGTLVTAIPAAALHAIRREREGERTDIVASVFA